MANLKSNVDIYFPKKCKWNVTKGADHAKNSKKMSVHLGSTFKCGTGTRVFYTYDFTRVKN